MTSREVIRKLKDDGWYEVGSKGDHFQFEHATKTGKVTVPNPQKDIRSLLLTQWQMSPRRRQEWRVN